MAECWNLGCGLPAEGVARAFAQDRLLAVSILCVRRGGFFSENVGGRTRVSFFMFRNPLCAARRRALSENLVSSVCRPPDLGGEVLA